MKTEQNPLPKSVWGYYGDCGKDLRFSFDKRYAEMSAGGFTWDNPRVRKVGIVLPVLDAAYGKELLAGLESARQSASKQPGDHAAMVVMRLEQAKEIIESLLA